MIYGRLRDFEMLVPSTDCSCLPKALTWIRSLRDEPELGRYELDSTMGMYALVMKYETLPAVESRFETHRRAIDLQYTLSGAEGIEWSHSTDLVEDGEYDAAKDLQFYLPSEPTAFVENRPGYFSIYTPTDAHRPKVRIRGTSEVFKLVVKIPVSAYMGK